MMLADEGADQASKIQEESGRLHRMVLENLMNLESEYRRSRMHILADLLTDLNEYLMELAGELQRLPDDYHKHAYKLFSKRSYGILPRVDEVLKRVCQMTEADGEQIAHRFLAGFDPPMLRPLFDPAGIIRFADRALERRSTPGDQRQPVCEVDGETIVRYEPELSTELMRRAFFEIIADVRHNGSIPLSKLLKRMVTREDPLLPVAVAMAVFQAAADNRIGAKYGFAMQLAGPEVRFSIRLPNVGLYRGHELVLRQLTDNQMIL
jgi:hypothetical protein